MGRSRQSYSTKVCDGRECPIRLGYDPQYEHQPVAWNGRAFHSHDCLERDRIIRTARDNLGTLVCGDATGIEWVQMTRHRTKPDKHPQVVFAHLSPSSNDRNRYRWHGFVQRSLQGGRNRSIVNKGQGCMTRSKSIEWINRQATSFNDPPIEWDSLDRIDISIDDYDYEGIHTTGLVRCE